MVSTDVTHYSDTEDHQKALPPNSERKDTSCYSLSSRSSTGRYLGPKGVEWEICDVFIYIGIIYLTRTFFFLLVDFGIVQLTGASCTVYIGSLTKVRIHTINKQILFSLL